MTNREKMLIGIVVVLIVAGIIVTALFGLNRGAIYKDMRAVEFYIATDVDVEDVRQITDMVFGDQKVIIQKVEFFNDKFSIRTEKISEEQFERLVELTNQAYGLEYSKEDIDIITIPGVNIMDTIVPYILPVLISLAVILTYMAIRFKKQGIVKAVFIPLFWVVLVLDICYSVMAITRIPIDQHTMPIAVGAMLATLTVVIYRFEKKALEEE